MAFEHDKTQKACGTSSEAYAREAVLTQWRSEKGQLLWLHFLWQHGKCRNWTKVAKNNYIVVLLKNRYLEVNPRMERIVADRGEVCQIQAAKWRNLSKLKRFKHSNPAKPQPRYRYCQKENSHHPVSCIPIIAKLLFTSSSTKASFRTSQLSFGSISWVCILMLKDATFHRVIGFKATEPLLTLDQSPTKRHKQIAKFWVWARNSCKVDCLG